MSFTERDYQTEAIQAMLQEFAVEGHRSGLIVLPTGSGKSVVMRGICQEFMDQQIKPILVMVHKIELVEQLAATLDTLDCTVVREQADHTGLQDSDDYEIAVCSIQTLLSRPEVLDDTGFGAVIIDETHRALADGYLEILDRISAGQADGPYLVGFTATAFRGDKQPLSDLYSTVIYQKDLLWGMREAWLTPIRAERLGIAEVDLQGRLVKRVLEDEELFEHVHDKFQEHCIDDGTLVRPTLIMASSVQQGNDIVQHFLDCGTPAAMVSYQTPMDQRSQSLQQFKDGELGVLVAMNILIEGFDAPRASCMFWLRNTESALVYAQGLGRITRPYFEDPLAFAQFNQSTDVAERKALIEASAKPDALFFDCTDIAAKYNLVTLGSIVGLHKAFDFEGEIITDIVDEIDELTDQYQVISTDLLLNAAEIGLVTDNAELWRQAVTPNMGVPADAELTYTKHRDHWLLSFPVHDNKAQCNVPHLVKVYADARGQWHALLGQPEVWREWYWNGRDRQWRQKYYKGPLPPDTSRKTKRYGRMVPTYERLCDMPWTPILTATNKNDIFSRLEDYLRTNYGTIWRLLAQDAPWRSNPPTPGQEKMLRKMRKKGIALPEELDSGTASVLTDRFFLGLLEPTKLKKRR